MTSNKVTTWTLMSADSLALGFPYSGRNFSRLFIRHGRERGGFEVFVAAEKGQIVCSGVEPCNVAVRFDQQPPTRFPAAHPSDGSPNVVFLNNVTRFIQGAKKSKIIRIELDFFHNGSRVIEFISPTPLELPTLSGNPGRQPSPHPPVTHRKPGLAPSPDSAIEDSNATRWVLDIGGLAGIGEMLAARLRIEQAGIKTFTVTGAKGGVTSVRAGPFKSRAEAAAAAGLLKEAGLAAKIIGL